MSRFSCWLGNHDDETVGINDNTYCTTYGSKKEYHEMRFYQCKSCGRRRFYSSVDLEYRDHRGMKAAKKNWLENGVVPEHGTWNFKGPGNTAGYIVPDYLAQVVDNQARLADALEQINQRLAILEPDSKKMKRFPALKAAYEQYKITEGLTYSDKD
jgi:hypothetical protein